jgi:hypothetical protein
MTPLEMSKAYACFLKGGVATLVAMYSNDANAHSGRKSDIAPV